MALDIANSHNVIITESKEQQGVHDPTVWVIEWCSLVSVLKLCSNNVWLVEQKEAVVSLIYGMCLCAFRAAV